MILISDTKDIMIPKNYTSEQFSLPLFVKIINWIGDTLMWLGIQIVSLSEKKIFENATQEIASSDWPENSHQIALEVLLHSFDNEANLSTFGRVFLNREFTRILTNNLKIQKDIRRYPKITEVAIQRPLFITGLPRSGTTLLHNLLAQDPSVRIPLMWELYQPSPPPETETRDTDPRIELTVDMVHKLYNFVPQLSTIHPLFPTGPDECIQLLKNSFMSHSFSLMGDIPSYLEWLEKQDMIPVYKFYRQQLQLLQWRTPGQPMILKSPSHLFAIDALLKVFPDASVIQLHRDPIKVIPSFCSFLTIPRNWTVQ